MSDVATEPISRLTKWRQRSPWIVATAFSVSGVIHIVRPSVFTGIVPTFLPGKTELVVVSGVAELVCAYGLWRREPWAGVASTALLLAVWPANLQMAITAQQGHNTAEQIADWARLPLQVPLIWCALQVRAAQPTARPLDVPTGGSASHFV